MNREELLTAITAFRQRVRAYRDLMVASRHNALPEIVRNGQEIAEMRTELNGLFGRLRRYVTKFGNNPRANDGVNPQVYPVYNNAFSNDILLRIGPSTDAVLQDLDYIVGTLEGMTDDEFEETMNPPQQEDTPRQNYWQLTNPIWLAWELAKFLWKHKVVSFVIAALGLLAIDYALAWQNATWVKDFIRGLF